MADQVDVEALRKRLSRELSPSRVEEVILDLTRKRPGPSKDTLERAESAARQASVPLSDLDLQWAQEQMEKAG